MMNERIKTESFIKKEKYFYINIGGVMDFNITYIPFKRR